MYIIRLTQKSTELYILNHYNNPLLGRNLAEARIFHTFADAKSWWNVHKKEIPYKIRKHSTIEILYLKIVSHTTISTPKCSSIIITILLILFFSFIYIFKLKF